MKDHYLGTCSGTEPMAGMHHCALVLEVNGLHYWFDAGENCSHTAYLQGLDLMQAKALFISHPHLDHIGGLANLFFCFAKLIRRYNRRLVCGNTLQVFCPDAKKLEAAKELCSFSGAFALEEHPLRDGVIFEDENIRVTAAHNLHMGCPAEGEAWRSYSFLIEGEGKRILFSGDVKKPEELDVLGAEEADLLIMETGHHDPAAVCAFAQARRIKRLRFTHHGRTIIEDRAAAEAMAEAYSADGAMSVKICFDGMTEAY